MSLACAVFILHRGLHILEIASKSLQYGEVVVSTVYEYIRLYFAISFLRIVIEFTEMLFRLLVIGDIVCHLLIVLLERTSDVDGKSKTDAAVHLCRVAESHRWHLVEIGDQGVVACYVMGIGFDVIPEWLRTGLELLVHLCSLMAGICKIEDVVLFLRVEHQ